MVTRGRTSAQASAGRRGRRPLRFARGMGGDGSLPLIRPCGATFPQGGEGKGCCWRQRKVSRNVGDAAPYGLPGEWAAAGACTSSGPAGPPSPKGEGKGCSGGIHPSRGVGGSGRPRRGGGTRPTDGDMETLWGLRGHPFPGRRAVGAGHARPGGVRGHPSMVRSVGRGLDPSAGVGGSGSLRGW